MKARDEVLAAAAELGYVSNRIAGSLASTASRLVAIVVPSLSNIVFADVVTGANSALDEAGIQCVIGVTDYDMQREEALIASMLAWRPAAIMVTGLEHTSPSLRMLRASAGRVAELIDTDGEGVDLVIGFSNRAAGVASARRLLSRGYRRFGYVGHDLERDKRAGKRFAGFRDTLLEAGCPLRDLQFTAAASSIEVGRFGLETLLARSPELDAVYFSNDDMAMGGYFHCLARGVSIPRELALFGFNGLNIGAFAPQPLTTIRTPRFAIGQVGAKQVISNVPAQTIDLGFDLIDGATA